MTASRWTGVSLTHWDRHKMAVMHQTTFWHAFSGMKIIKFRLKFHFHWSLFIRVESTIFDIVYQRIYASLGLNESIRPSKTNVNDTWIKMREISYHTMSLSSKMPPVKRRPSCSRLNISTSFVAKKIELKPSNYFPFPRIKRHTIRVYIITIYRATP